MSDCLFCKIINNEVPSERVYEDEKVLGFKDIMPNAKEHYLFISKEHSKNVNEMINNDEAGLIATFKAISKFTRESDLEREGFRVVTNTNKNSGQVVFHTHFHVLGGETLNGFGSR